MATAPQMDVWVRISLTGFIVLMIVAIVVYHLWLDRIARRAATPSKRPGDAASDAPSPVDASRARR
jgi:hypothetical protein